MSFRRRTLGFGRLGIGLLPLLLLPLFACPGPTQTDAGSDAGSAADDAGQAGPDAGTPDGGADAGQTVREEIEPNDGAMLDEVDTLGLGERVQGVIGAAGDQDIFAVETVGATLYRVHLRAEGPSGASDLIGHVTVIDDGRDDEAAGSDFVQISRAGAESDVNLEFMAMGDGHLIAIRDARNVDGADMFGPELAYQVWVEEISESPTAVTFPSTISDQLAHAGALKAYAFTASQGQEALFTLTTGDQIDARFFVVSAATGSWIARNADSGAGNANPRIDAPLFADGEMFLIVDNTAETATDLSYTLSLELDP